MLECSTVFLDGVGRRRKVGSTADCAPYLTLRRMLRKHQDSKSYLPLASSGILRSRPLGKLFTCEGHWREKRRSYIAGI